MSTVFEKYFQAFKDHSKC